MNTTHPCQTAPPFLGEGPRLQEVRQQLHEVAPTDLTVLLLGETGTGKGVAARVLHEESLRRAGPFVPVNCGALPESLVDSELFGHERGAFTGAVAQKKGKCELANGGTLFLDEIGDLPLLSQTRLLRVLQERVFERVGGTHTLSLDVRIIAATHQDLKQAVAAGRFRQDLYYRLHVFPVRIPPLRERLEDLPLLSVHFAGQELSSEALAVLHSYAWPGNVRELEHTLQRAQVLAKGGEIRPEHILLEPAGVALPLAAPVSAGPQDRAAQPDRAGDQASPRLAPGPLLPLAEYERQYLSRVLAHTQGVIHGPRGAARLLMLKPTTLRSRLQKLGLLPKGVGPCSCS